MKKKILVTGATDGIGLETVKMMKSQGHHLLLHGRNQEKLEKVKATLGEIHGDGSISSYIADLASIEQTQKLASTIINDHDQLDILVNNAGVYGASGLKTEDGLDIRFAVNTIAPYILTKRLLPLFGTHGRVINLSSAAQFPVDPAALIGKRELSDGAAYAQSKLALTMWSRSLGLSLKESGPVIIAVNPRSMLGSKMVKQAYGVVGDNLEIGAEILCRASLTEEFSSASGLYFDNDIGQFTSPHPEALDNVKCNKVIAVIDSILGE